MIDLVAGFKCLLQNLSISFFFFNIDLINNRPTFITLYARSKQRAAICGLLFNLHRWTVNVTFTFLKALHRYIHLHKIHCFWLPKNSSDWPDLAPRGNMCRPLPCKLTPVVLFYYHYPFYQFGSV